MEVLVRSDTSLRRTSAEPEAAAVGVRLRTRPVMSASSHNGRAKVTFFHITVVLMAIAGFALPVEAMLCERFWDIELIDASDPMSVGKESDTADTAVATADEWVTSRYAGVTVYGPGKSSKLVYELEPF